MPNSQLTASKVSGGSVILGALIGLGFCLLLAALGGAIAMSRSELESLPSSATIALISIISILLLATAFFIAGYVAARASHQQTLFDSIVHSLGTWAVLSILLMLSISTTSFIEEVHHSLSSVKLPAVVTDVKLLKGQAVTTISTPPHEKHETPAEKKADSLVAASWWIAFLALLFGSGASVLGGLLARKKWPKALS